MRNGIPERRAGPTRREFEELEGSVQAIQKQLAELKDLMTINTEMTSDIRFVIRGSKFLITAIKGTAALTVAVGVIFGGFLAIIHWLRGGGQ